MDNNKINKIVKDALEHDKKLNEGEIKVVEEIEDIISKINDNLEKFKVSVLELKKFDENELETPLSKDEEYSIFFKAIESYNEASRLLNKLLTKLIEYKKLLDEELY